MRLTPTGPNEVTLHVDDLGGEARARAATGDADGSGDLPCVHLEIAHDYIAGGSAAIALSAREAEALAKALIISARRIPPSQRLKVRCRRPARRSRRAPSPTDAWAQQETPDDVIAGLRAAPIPPVKE